MLDGIAYICQTTNPTCREEVQSGLTNSLQEMNPQDEKHKTDTICSAYNVNNDQQVKFSNLFVSLYTPILK